jgi:thymidylate synthase
MEDNKTNGGVNPKEQHAFWRENYAKQAYVNLGQPYGEYAPAYQYGWESHGRMAGKSFDQSESELARGWNAAKRQSTLSWEKAKAATKDAWNRIEGILPGDADGDGR